MAPSPPEHATSAVDQAYDAFDESSITLQEMVEKKLSAGSINRQTHTSLDRSVSPPRYRRGACLIISLDGNRPLHEQLGGPNSPCFERTAKLAPRLLQGGDQGQNLLRSRSLYVPALQNARDLRGAS